MIIVVGTIILLLYAIGGHYWIHQELPKTCEEWRPIIAEIIVYFTVLIIASVIFYILH